MGHLINPISYRLGHSRFWNSVWFNDPKKLSFNNNVKHDRILYLFFNRFFNCKLVVKLGFIFSHLKIYKFSNKLICIVNFFDGSYLERFYFIKKLMLASETFNSFFFLFFKFTLNYFFSNYKINVFFNFFSTQLKKNFLFDFFFKKRFVYTLLIKNNFEFFDFYFKKFYNLISFVIIYFFLFYHNKNFKIYFLFFYIKKFFFYTILKVFCYWSFKFLFYKFFSLENNFLLFLNFNKILYRHKKLKKLYLDFFLYKKSNLIVLKTKIKDLNKNYKNFFFFVIKNFFFYKFLVSFLTEYISFFFKLRLVIDELLKLYFIKLFNNIINFVVIWKMVPLFNINASIISKYVCIRLLQGFSLMSVIYPVIRYLSKDNTVKGFRLVCAGRFSKNEIASYELKTYSSVPFSSVFRFLDYALSEAILKHSKCGIKIWLHKSLIYLKEKDYELVESWNESDFYDLTVFNFYNKTVNLLKLIIFLDNLIFKLNFLNFIQLKFYNFSKKFYKKIRKSYKFFILSIPDFDFYFVN